MGIWIGTFSFYWFFRNLAAFTSQILCFPLFLLGNFTVLVQYLFAGWDGSCEIPFPWQIDWKDVFTGNYYDDDDYNDDDDDDDDDYNDNGYGDGGYYW